MCACVGVCGWVGGGGEWGGGGWGMGVWRRWEEEIKYEMHQFVVDMLLERENFTKRDSCYRIHHGMCP